MNGPSGLNSRIHVSGGTGLVGSAIQWAISKTHPLYGKHDDEQWIFASSADGDLRDYEQAKALFYRRMPDQVIHLAARVGGVYENNRKPVQFIQDNLSIDQNVLRLCHELKAQKLVSCPSTFIFPDQVSYPIKESMLAAYGTTT